jgi:hypothetical protein
MCIGEKMNLKIGDKVKMNKEGTFYHNPDNMFDAHNVGGFLNAEHYEQLICEFMAVQNVGEVKELDEHAVRVRFHNSLNGRYYFFTMWYEPSHLSKLTFFQKLKHNIFGRI